MTPEIHHYLVVYDTGAGKATVTEFDDSAEALSAYSAVEDENRDRADIEVVLLSADSIETIRRTHSSYFDAEESFERLLPRGVLHTA